MDTFIAGNVLWPENWSKLHVYFIPDLAEIKDLVDIYQGVIAEFAFLAPVPDEWLHATVQMIDQPAAQHISPQQRTELETGLRQQIGGLAPFTLTAGGAVAGRSGVVLDLTPDAAFTEIIHRARAVIRDVLGDASIKYSNSRPHITLGYARDHGDSGVVQSKLRHATDQRATITVAEVSLVDVLQDPERHEYRWRRLARFPFHTTTQVPAARRRAGLVPVPADADIEPMR